MYYTDFKEKCKGLGRKKFENSSLASADAVATLVGKLVGLLVAGFSGMSLHPTPLDVELSAETVELLPEFAVLDGGFRGGHPVLLLPTVDPLGDAVFDVTAVGVNDDGAGTTDELQGFDDGREFHLIVGDVRRTAENFLRMSAPDEIGAPTSDSGVAFGSAVGPNFQFSVHVLLLEEVRFIGNFCKWVVFVRF